MSFEQYTLSDYLKAFRRRIKPVAAVFIVIAGTATTVALLLPPVYRSSAEFRVDLEGPNLAQLRAIDLTNYADQYIRSLQQEVLSYDNRRQWLENENLYPDLRDELSENELVSRIGRNASVELVMTTVLDNGREVELVTGFRTAFEAGDPQSAQVVARNMADAFIGAERAARARRASTATTFLGEEISRKQEEIAQIEGEIADFKERNAGTLPEMRSFNMTSLERAERDLQAIETEISTAEQDLFFRRAQLEEMRQTSASAERLQQLEDEYLSAVSIYGPEHPTVLRIRRQVAALTGNETTSGNPEIAALEADLASMRERYSEEHPDVRNAQRRLETLREQEQTSPNREPTDVRYLQLSAQINATETRLEGLRQRQRELRNTIDQMESRLALMPQVEREYLALERQLETAQLAFNDLRQQAADARQTEAFESGERGARIELVASAGTPSEPAGPPRLAIIVLGILFGTTLAVGAGVGAEALDQTIRSPKDIYGLLQTRPIASIPIVENSIWLAQRRRRLVITAATVGVIAAAVLAVYSSLA